MLKASWAGSKATTVGLVAALKVGLPTAVACALNERLVSPAARVRLAGTCNPAVVVNVTVTGWLMGYGRASTTGTDSPTVSVVRLAVRLSAPASLTTTAALPCTVCGAPWPCRAAGVCSAVMRVWPGCWPVTRPPLLTAAVLLLSLFQRVAGSVVMLRALASV
ncbi:hypothetical protein FQZ97_1005720 [compost metagenome]